jgi:uncharacterized protein (DUF2252 family)
MRTLSARTFRARQMDGVTRKRFLRDLKRRSSKRLDAPSWLWSSVVDLAGVHEVAYLEHCRQYSVENRAHIGRTRRAKSSKLRHGERK